jgi:hypothetical protein
LLNTERHVLRNSPRLANGPLKEPNAGFGGAVINSMDRLVEIAALLASDTEGVAA